MSLVNIRATFQCDGCARTFSCGLTPDSELPKGWSLFDAAEDAIRGGLDYHDNHTPRFTVLHGLVINHEHFCKTCVAAKENDEEEIAS